MYGGGTFGQQLMRRFIKKYHVAGRMNGGYWEYRRCRLGVDYVDNMFLLAYNNVVIASLDIEYVFAVSRKLKDYGVSENVIISVDTTKEQRVNAIERYLK